MYFCDTSLKIFEAFALNLAFKNWYFLNGNEKISANAHAINGVGSLIVPGIPVP
jgi:hypothetical protein